MKRTLFICLLVIAQLGAGLLNSAKLESNVIQGSVLDIESKEALVGVKIEIPELGKTVYTDFDGAFTVTGVEAGVYTAEVSFVSYKNIKTRIVYPNNQFVQIKIQMSE